MQSSITGGRQENGAAWDSGRHTLRPRGRRIPWAVLAWLFVVVLGIQADIVTEPDRTYGLGDLSVAALSTDKRHLATAGTSAAYLWDFGTGTVRHRLHEHGGPVTALAFSPDGRWLVTGTRMGGIGVWSTEDGAMLRVFDGHRGDINSLRFSPDGERFVSASADNTAAVWSIPSGTELQRVSVPGASVQAALFTRDGKGIVTADTSLTEAVRLWDVESGKVIRTLGAHRGTVLSLAFLADGRLATGGEDRAVHLWDLETGKLSGSLEGARGSVRHLAVVPEGPLLMAGCDDLQVAVWNTATGNALHFWGTDPLGSLSWVPGTEQALTATSDLRVRVVDLKTGLTQRVFEGHTTSVTLGVSFSPDGQSVVSGGVEKSTRLWNRSQGTFIRAFDGNGAGSAAAEFSPDGRLVLTTYGHPRMSAQLWNAATGGLERELRGHTDWLLAAKFSPDGTHIATGSQDRTLRIWETQTGRLLQTLGNGSGFIHCVAFSRDGKRVAGGGSSFDPTVRVWDVASGELRATYSAEAGTVKGLAFSPDGNELFVAWEDGLIRVLSLQTGQVVRELVSGGFLNDLALSPDGDLLLTGEGWPSFVARLIDWRTGQDLRVFARHAAPVESVAFSAGGAYVLTGADVVRLWDITPVLARLKMERTPSGLELSWSVGTLQHATSAGGPWRSLDDVRSPWTPPLDLGSGFFRVSVTAADGVR